jgi:hypothetical protein
MNHYGNLIVDGIVAVGQRNQNGYILPESIGTSGSVLTVIQDNLGNKSLQFASPVASTSLSDITSTVDVGAISSGDTIPAGSTLDDFIKQLVEKTYYPTFTPQTVQLTSNLSSSVESGTSGSVNLTSTFNKGSINGQLVSNIWIPSQFQDYRAGNAAQYNFSGSGIVGSVNNGLTNTYTVSAYQIVDGSNTWNTIVNHLTGPQPLDSTGANYSTPAPSGSVSAGVTVNGYRKAFYGSDSSSTTVYTTSNEVRGLSGSTLNPHNGSTFTINIPIGAKMVIFAYPATLEDVATVKYVEGLNAEVKGIFNKTLVNVAGQNGYSPISYKVYTYIPAVPFPSTATYNVTI